MERSVTHAHGKKKKGQSTQKHKEEKIITYLPITKSVIIKHPLYCFVTLCVFIKEVGCFLSASTFHLQRCWTYNQMAMLLKADRLRTGLWPEHYFKGKLNSNVSRKVFIS